MIKENFADPLDRATMEQEQLLNDQIRAAKALAPQALPYTGACYNCGEKLADPLRFCDKDCCDDHTKISRSRSAQFRRLE